MGELFTQEECCYSNFNIENQDIMFESNCKDISISIPIKDNTTNCVKEKLNEFLLQSMNEKLTKGMEGYMSFPRDLLLNARMEIIYDWELGVQYYLAITIKDFDFEELIDKRILITSPSKLHNEFVSYCRYKLDKILFPIW